MRFKGRKREIGIVCVKLKVVGFANYEEEDGSACRVGLWLSSSRLAVKIS